MQRRLRTKLVIAAAAFGIAIPGVAACGSGYQAGVINVYPPADGASEIAKIAEKCSAGSGGAYRIVSTPLPKSADDQRLQLARRLAGNDHGLDLMGMDVVWTAEFADAGWIKPVPDALAKTISAQTLSGPLETARWKTASDTEKRLYAIPTWTNTQFVWYRPDVMRQYLQRATPPKTWDQLLSDNKTITDAGGPSYIMVQGKQYEGLMVWFTSVLASAGGQILDPNDPNKVTLADTPEHRAATVKALSILKAVATAKGHDPSLTNSDEGSARLGMETGKASFEINWPFVWASMRSNAAAGDVPFFTDSSGKIIPALAPYTSMLTDEENPPTDAELAPANRAVRTKFSWGLYPGVSADHKMRPPLGGINLAVASTSRQPELAFQAAQCLTNAQAQKQYAVSGGTPPTIASIYDEPDFKASYPMGDDIRRQLEITGAPARPASPVYQSISTLITAKLSPVGQWDPEALVDPLVEQVRKAINGEGLVP
ncbi:extracellular solute-binding protein [Gordonia sp. CPCC 205333]|uniref:extracellular solute-binding protein n=1 Tax=Gordonia sp. CPCC 205333 TaxID=3140790 RepID=UPI003AF33D02